MIIGIIFILGMLWASLLYGFHRVVDLLCVGVLISGVGLMLYYGFILS